MLQEEPLARPYELRAQNAKALLQRLYRNLSELVREEIELARVEVRERGTTGAAAVQSLAFSTAFAFVGLASLAACAIAGLAYVLPLWLGALIVGVVSVGVAFGLARSAQHRFARVAQPMRSTLGKLFNPLTNQTADELQSRIEVTRKQVDETIAALEQKTDLLAPMKDTAIGLGSLGVAVSAIVRSESSGRA
jgi:Putative Actinobacterial Holin-X, holin superfamily III